MLLGIFPCHQKLFQNTKQVFQNVPIELDAVLLGKIAGYFGSFFGSDLCFLPENIP